MRCSRPSSSLGSASPVDWSARLDSAFTATLGPASGGQSQWTGRLASSLGEQGTAGATGAAGEGQWRPTSPTSWQQPPSW